MTETAEPRPPAQDTVAMTAATMAHDIVAAQLQELRSLPDHWSRLSAEVQQKAIERMKERASSMVKTAIAFMTTSDFKAVPATIQYVKSKKGISAGITINKDAVYRHALFDAEGRQVLIVITEPEQWLTRMDEIKAKGNQLELFDYDANYSPERDQPGYRRDLDPLAPGARWDELKKSLGFKTPDPPAAVGLDPSRGDDQTSEIPPGESLTPEQQHQATLRELQDRLAAIGCPVSLGELQARTDADILAVTLWLKWYESDKIDVPYLERPAFLPQPKNPSNNSGETK